jgi:nicotinate-nucleotide adenylyltransferase
VASVGILGGTFNPPHVAHVAAARAARDQLGLDRVVLMPVATPPHKPLPDDPGPDVRLELARRAARDEAGLDVSDLELRRGGPSYTVATLEALHEDRPEDELTFIAGGDMAASLPEWRDPERVLELARFAVAERDDAGREAIERRNAGLRGRERIVFLDLPPIDVSSSDVRRRVAAGEPIDDRVPPAVAEYIAQRGLYRPAATAR